jgi:hypothetical protein
MQGLVRLSLIGIVRFRSATRDLQALVPWTLRIDDEADERVASRGAADGRNL